jgi:integrase
MTEANSKRIRVWVQHMADRPHLMLQWTDPDTGKRCSKTAGTANPKDAEDARTDLEADLNAGRHHDAGRMPWDNFRRPFEAEYVATARQNTRVNFAKTLNLFERYCNPRTIDRITVRTLSAFALALRTARVRGGRKGYAPGTVKVHLQFLHTALSWAAEQKLLAECPKFPAARVLTPTPQPVPAEAVEKLLAKAPDQAMRTFLLCGWLAGLRLSEAIALEWEPAEKAPYIDLARNRIIFPAAFVKGKRDQWVPLDPELRAALEALPRHGSRVFRMVSPSGTPLTLCAYSHRIRGIARRAGVRMTMKTLRRGFGCRYAGRVPAQVLQKLMRHNDIKVTMTYYANVDDAVEAAVLGPQRNSSHTDFSVRNSSRNNQPPATAPPADAEDATPWQERGL